MEEVSWPGRNVNGSMALGTLILKSTATDGAKKVGGMIIKAKCFRFLSYCLKFFCTILNFFRVKDFITFFLL